MSDEKVLIKEVQWLVSMRRDFHVPRREIAAFLKIPEVTIYRWEAGIHRPSPTHQRMLAALALFFGKDALFFEMDGEGSNGQRAD